MFGRGWLHPRTRRTRHPQTNSDEQTFLHGLRSVVDLITPSSWEVHRSSLRIDDQYVRSLVIVGLPRSVGVAWLSPLIGFGEPLDLSIHLTSLESSAVINTLTHRMVQLQSSRLLDAGEGRLADPEREIAYADCERLRDALQRGDERIFSVGISITLRASSLEALEHLTRSVETTIAGMLAQSRRCTFEHEAGFRASLPEARDNLGVRRSLDTSSLASAFPFTSASLVQPTGVLYGVNLHDHSLVIVDPFSPELPNANCCVFAESGMGKSFAVKLELLRSLVLGVDYVVIDPENEYTRLASAVGGQVIRLATSSSDKINPFDLPAPGDGNADALEEKLESMLTFVELLVADPAHPLGPTERATLHSALRQTYQGVGITDDPRTHDRTAPILADLQRVLKDRPDGGSFAARLERYVTGRLGHVFSGRTNVDLSRPLVVFDVRDLAEELRPVAMFLIADFVWTRVRETRTMRRLVIDEAWTLVQTEVGGKFLASVARRARKYFLGLTVISQDVGDFLGTEQGRAVLQNSALKLLLRQDASAIDRVVETLKLSDGERDLLLRLGKGQALLCTPETRVAVEITAAPAEHRLITSDPRELTVLEAIGQADHPVDAAEASSTRERPGTTGDRER
jgi:conjugal transfer ATP-binding protein TraC